MGDQISENEFNAFEQYQGIIKAVQGGDIV